MYEKFGKLMMWSYPLPCTRRLYRSNPRDFGKMFASMYAFIIPIVILEILGAKWLFKRFLAEEEPTPTETYMDQLNSDEAGSMTKEELIAAINSMPLSPKRSAYTKQLASLIGAPKFEGMSLEEFQALMDK